MSDDDMTKYFQTHCEDRYPPVNTRMIFDQKPHQTKDISYLLGECKNELSVLEGKDIIHEVVHMIAPETVTNLKQDYILDEPTFHKIDNEPEQEKKASLVFNPTSVDTKIFRDTDKIDLHFEGQPQTKEKSYSVKEEHHMEPINSS